MCLCAPVDGYHLSSLSKVSYDALTGRRPDGRVTRHARRILRNTEVGNGVRQTLAKTSGKAQIQIPMRLEQQGAEISDSCHPCCLASRKTISRTDHYTALASVPSPSFLYLCIKDMAQHQETNIYASTTIVSARPRGTTPAPSSIAAAPMARPLLRLRVRPRIALSSAPPACCRAQYSSTLAPSSTAALLSRSAHQTTPASDTLTLNGFVRSVRKQKRVAFAAVGDGSSLKTVQVVLAPEQASQSVNLARTHTSI